MRTGLLLVALTSCTTTTMPLPADDSMSEVASDVDGRADTILAPDAGDDCTDAGLGKWQCMMNADRTCPSGCWPIKGGLWRESEGCYDATAVVVACASADSSFDKTFACSLEVATGQKYLTPVALRCPWMNGWKACVKGGDTCGGP